MREEYPNRGVPSSRTSRRPSSFGTLQAVIRMADLETRLKGSLRDDRLPCASAFEVSKELDLPPAEVGDEADRLGIRISRCQLGIFGYDAFGQKGLLQSFVEVPGDLTAALNAAATENGIPCVGLWCVAEEHGLPYVAVGCAVETLGLRVTSCQLGCF